MDRYRSFCVLTDVEELPDDAVGRCTPVHEEQVVVFKAGVGKTPGIVHLLVEADDSGDVVFSEVRNVGLGSMQRIPWGKRGKHSSEFKRRNLCKSLLDFSITIFYFAFWMRSAECKELPWNDPVQVSIFSPLIVLVFLHIEVGEVQPAVLQSLTGGWEGVNFIMCMTQQERKINRVNLTLTYLLNGTEAIQDVQVVHAASKWSVSVKQIWQSFSAEIIFFPLWIWMQTAVSRLMVSTAFHLPHESCSIAFHTVLFL